MDWRCGVMASMLSAVLLATAARGDDASLLVTANRDQVYLGESVVLTVKVSGADRQEPDLSGIQNCRVRALGSQSDSHFSIQIVNGQMKREGFSGRVYTYELTPTAVGTFQAGPVHLSVGGQVLTEAGPTIAVTGVEEQTRVLVSVTSSKEAVLVDESFDIVLAIDVERMKGQFAEQDPVDPSAPPLINVDYLQGAPITGLDGPDMKSLLQQRLANRPEVPGFAINNYTIRRDPFSAMFNFNMDELTREAAAKFVLDRRAVEKNGKSYFEYSLKLTYTARDEGNHTFGPAVFKGKVALGADGTGRVVGRQIFAVGPACTVRVVPPPEEGRPASFIGAIGSNVTARAAFDAQTCSVGDPLTLTLTVSGNITQDNLRPLVLGDQPSLVKDFKIYDDSVKMIRKEGRVEFSYTVRPTRAGTLEFPPIDVSYYDATARAYRTVRTAAIPVRANKAAEVATDMVIDTGTNRNAQGTRTLEVSALVVAPIDVDPQGAEADPILAPLPHGALAGAGPMAFAAAAAAVALRRLRRARAAGRRGRHALRNATRRLDEAKRLATGDPPRAGAILCEAIRSYVADRFDARSSAVTPSDAREILQRNRIGGDLVGPLCAILERNFNASYAHGSGPRVDTREDCDAAARAIEQIEGICLARESGKETAPS